MKNKILHRHFSSLSLSLSITHTDYWMSTNRQPGSLCPGALGISCARWGDPSWHKQGCQGNQCTNLCELTLNCVVGVLYVVNNIFCFFLCHIVIVEWLYKLLASLFLSLLVHTIVFLFLCLHKLGCFLLITRRSQGRPRQWRRWP